MLHVVPLWISARCFILAFDARRTMKPLDKMIVSTTSDALPRYQWNVPKDNWVRKLTIRPARLKGDRRCRRTTYLPLFLPLTFIPLIFMAPISVPGINVPLVYVSSEGSMNGC